MKDSDSIIRVDNVWKKFTLSQGRAGDLRERFAALRESRHAAPSNELWALKDVSFAIKPGESVGIVGHNGSGKSTMLKMLTGILKPTKGEIHINGRVGALIEVGAGFHPDLSGRENIFLNGSILGLSRQEIARKFDDIVSFAGLEKFVDTPVKRYSSGMYMRLGFSVAAHTAPDILLIDEVLAVGDTFFQRKCIEHLKNFVRQGGAVVFVSHSMGQMIDICESCLWLDHGDPRFYGPTKDAVDQYMTLVFEREEEEFRKKHPDEWAAREALRQIEEEEARRLQEQERLAEIEAKAEAERRLQEAERRSREEAERRSQEQEARLRARQADPTNPLSCRITDVILRDANGTAHSRFHPGEALTLEIGYRFGRRLPEPIFGVDIYREDDLHIFTTSNYDHRLSLAHLSDSGALRLTIPSLNLTPGWYRVQINLFADSSRPQWWENPEDERRDAAFFEVATDATLHGCVYLPVHWNADEPAMVTPSAVPLSVGAAVAAV